MASLNMVQIIGNLGRDPEIRYMPSGDAIANLAIATSYKPKDKDEVVEWHRVSLFGRLAEIAGEYLKKGSSVYIQGRLQTRKYTDKDGIERYATEIVGENMKMLGGRQGGEGGGQAAPAQRPQQQRPAQQDGQQRGGAKPAPNFSDVDDDIPF